VDLEVHVAESVTSTEADPDALRTDEGISTSTASSLVTSVSFGDVGAEPANPAALGIALEPDLEVKLR
jgi:hypothetical protein